MKNEQISSQRIPLGQFSVEEFLADYWQKKPVLIRQAFPNFKSPIEPDELAGLACQDDTFSRLVQETGGDYPWQARGGPFSEEDFAALGDSNWAFLVQEIDRHVPAIADLFDHFDFLPAWRRDDVMISFASKGGGVGPHIDSYDVFILQGSGTRRWEIGPPDRDYVHVPDLDLRILANFEPSETFILQPGDMLYLPPGVPHNGVAIEPCLNYSFGFLGPAQTEMLSEFAGWCQLRNEAVRFQDRCPSVGIQPGIISDSDIDQLIAFIREFPVDRESFVEWFGKYSTRPQRVPLDADGFEGELEEFLADFKAFGSWRRHEGVRVAGRAAPAPQLFVDGELWPGTLSAETICAFTDRRAWTYSELQSEPEMLTLLYGFTERGWGYFPSDESSDDD